MRPVLDGILRFFFACSSRPSHNFPQIPTNFPQIPAVWAHPNHWDPLNGCCISGRTISRPKLRPTFRPKDTQVSGRSHVVKSALACPPDPLWLLPACLLSACLPACRCGFQIKHLTHVGGAGACKAHEPNHPLCRGWQAEPSSTAARAGQTFQL